MELLHLRLQPTQEDCSVCSWASAQYRWWKSSTSSHLGHSAIINERPISNVPLTRSRSSCACERMIRWITGFGMCGPAKCIQRYFGACRQRFHIPSEKRPLHVRLDNHLLLFFLELLTKFAQELEKKEGGWDSMQWPQNRYLDNVFSHYYSIGTIQ